MPQDYIAQVLKNTEKGLNIAEKTGRFIAPLIKGTIEQGIGIFEDKLKYIRWERQLRLMMKADALMKENHIDHVENPIPMKLVIPLLQAATMEENDDLQDIWANLLVNSIKENGIELKRVYIDILERISPIEAKILDKIYELPFEEYQHTLLCTHELPERVTIYKREEYDENNHLLVNQEVELSLMNLARIGCLSPCRSVGGGELYSMINMTLLGIKFVDACTIKNK